MRFSEYFVQVASLAEKGDVVVFNAIVMGIANAGKTLNYIVCGISAGLHTKKKA